MVESYIGLGSNLGDRRKNIEKALELIKALPAVKIVKSSSLYESRPQGCPAGSPDFLNSVLKIKTSLPAPELLRQLQDIENKLGRKRTSQRNAPRGIDLDILLYGRQKINLPRLKIPHPRLKERAFVLKPLKEIAPRLIHSLAEEIPVISKIARMRQFIQEIKKQDKTIGFVPTMGYLHQGHLSLIKQAKKDCDICLLSVFVNPIQFGPQEDYKKYPRDLEQDRLLARSAGCDCVFYPEVKEMYPEDYLTYVEVDKISQGLCGRSRPGHFRGVTTVVNKLFNIVQPDIAYFGQKDYQQALVIKRMVSDLNMPLKIKVMPIIREADGLAMSSRNSYLNPQEREDAAVLEQSLCKAKRLIESGERDSAKIIAKIKEDIAAKDSANIDYVSIVNSKTLEELKTIRGDAVITLAVWFGKTRLIDNMTIRCL